MDASVVTEVVVVLESVIELELPVLELLVVVDEDVVTETAVDV